MSSLETPCPRPARPADSRQLAEFPQDDTCTLDIDYTRAADRLFGHAGPKRPQRRGAKTAGVAIFEDVSEEAVSGEVKRVPGKTLLSKPARKLPGKVAIKTEVKPASPQPLGEMRQARTRPSALPSVQQTEVSPKNRMAAANMPSKRDDRRRTIFVPSDDTTMLTIHPGVNNTHRLDDTFHPRDFASRHMDFDLKPSPAAANVHSPMEAPRSAKKPRMSIAPKRLPLQHLPVKEHNSPTIDIAGQNGGKENVPPGEAGGEKPVKAMLKRKEILKSSPMTLKTRSPPVAQVKSSPVPRTKLFEPTAASQARQAVVPRKAVPLVRGREMVVQPTQKRTAPQSHPITRRSPEQPRPWHKHAASQNPPQSTFKRPTPPKTTPKLLQYPLLSEDIAQPQLYEESWLSHQEIALTELINEIFTKASPCSAWHMPDSSLREQMLTIYHQLAVTTLHSRLKASLLYGALSRPKDMPSPPDPTHDLGLRKRFLNLWLHTYNEEALRAAAEVVVGRQVPASQHGSLAGEAVASVMDPATTKRALIGFLETFLVTVEDCETGQEEGGSLAERRWRDRPLRHMEYVVESVQDPLDEVDYRIQNIATDFRDGIFLTRLVEVLLFSAKRTQEMEDDGDATMTLQLPDLTMIESARYTDDGTPCPRILSQHLKMPTLARAQKMYNVQVTLSALYEHEQDIANEITAEDIVNGHREKTLSLLWSLVSAHGLAQLVDWTELAKDVRRVSGNTTDLQEQQEYLLQAWATVYGACNGLHISNLTTSFADGKAYDAILQAFADLLPSASTKRSSTTGASVEARLRSLGCSTAFIKQLTSSRDTIPSRTTTISNLAFLASRLLPLARRHNAAVTVQRAFRRRLARQILARRVASARLAEECANVTQLQQREATAAIVMQRAWRNVLSVRSSRLNADVLAFQVVARGWRARRLARSPLRAEMGYHERSLGW
ncbi:hypothetical protein LTR97_005983 [Elasticomyces elasticus]|uniref:Calponin-homology (CH) domain-containing protein n=1 Tax=Elasticomyces elasticus TaxID=574655 RepID=A0AAN7W5X5_9PEZI|nr:hypothetical protein LTR97_005983 [Elasticomyces elasticus]